MPTRPVVSVGSEHTRNVCLNSHPSSIKETDCCPLISRTSPVTLYSSIVVTRHLDMLRCSINTLEPVFKNQASRQSLYLQWDSGCAMLQQNGNCTHYNSTVRGIQVEGAVFIHTSFPFPWFFVSCLTTFFILPRSLSPGERERAHQKHLLGFLLPGVVVKLTSLLSLVGHPIAKCPTPSH